MRRPPAGTTDEAFEPPTTSHGGRRVAGERVPVARLLRDRYSPSRFDEQHRIDDDSVLMLLHAAQRSPSAGNSQPWAFVVGRRDDVVHRRIVPHLAASTRPWASSASMLVVNLAHVTVEDSDLEYSEFSLYDLGQASAMLAVQALDLGLATHQFRGFDRSGLEAELALPAHWQASTITAIGRAHPTDPHHPPDGALSSSSPARRPLASVVRLAAPALQGLLREPEPDPSRDLREPVVVTSWAPAACTLPTAERPLREAEFAEVFQQHLRSVRLTSPTSARFTLATGSCDRLQALIARETDCCDFFTFSLDPDGAVLVMTVDAPDQYADVLAALVADADAAARVGQDGSAPRPDPSGRNAADTAQSDPA